MRSILLASAALSVMARAFNNEVCETVVVKTDAGNVRINKSDYDADPKSFTLASKKDQEGSDTDAPGAGEVTASTVAPNVDPGPVPSSVDNGDGQLPNDHPLPDNQRMVAKEGTGKNARYFITDAQGNKLTGDGINDKEGYATDAEAWNVIMKDLPR